jgi:hypothetical protein
VVAEYFICPSGYHAKEDARMAAVSPTIYQKTAEPAQRAEKYDVRAS